MRSFLLSTFLPSRLGIFFKSSMVLKGPLLARHATTESASLPVKSRVVFSSSAVALLTFTLAGAAGSLALVAAGGKLVERYWTM